jgi:hypothetical protein
MSVTPESPMAFNTAVTSVGKIFVKNAWFTMTNMDIQAGVARWIATIPHMISFLIEAEGRIAVNVSVKSSARKTQRVISYIIRAMWIRLGNYDGI